MKAAIKALQKGMSQADQDAVSAIVSEMSKVNLQHTYQPDAIHCLTLASLEYTQAVLSLHMAAQATTK